MLLDFENNSSSIAYKTNEENIYRLLIYYFEFGILFSTPVLAKLYIAFSAASCHHVATVSCEHICSSVQIL
jgi:hypothetical protein